VIIDPDKISALIIECADLYIVPRYNALADHEIMQKTGPNDLVTQADIDVENHLIRVLPDLYPGSVVVGEEGVSNGTVDANLLQGPGKFWIVDPVDGTNNFVKRKREFGVMMAYVVDGVTQAAWIYDVLGKEMTAAEQGAGAFCAGSRLALSGHDRPMSEITGFMSLRYFPKEQRAALKESQKKFGMTDPLFCAAHEYLGVAKGVRDFALYSRLKPWDHVPGALIVAESGGFVAKWDGSPYTARDHDGGLIAARSREIWEKVHATIVR
jgi:fructose-1,6-bisphosphatase/inositol monophosphatase family enzyme